ncbi:hypothetical protein J3R83DRAFT_10305 [Lanmaoa asiatica]|nr:hypothetical protein J3R83DRAFT_10305 [Lanmaoa asiatica]
MGESQPASVHDVTRDFAIFVPSTNFPPALDYPRSKIGLREEKFVRVAFTNGTTAEIPVGFTAFHPFYDPPSDQLVRSKIVRLRTKESLDGSHVDSGPVANYTAKIIGKGCDDQFIKVATTRIGRARTFVEPLTLHVCIDSSLSPRWASEHTSDPSPRSLHTPNQILRATSTDFKPPTSRSTSCCISLNKGHLHHPKHISTPNATADQIAAGEIVTTTSNPAQFLIDPDLRHFTDFETYYQSLSSALFLSLEVPRTEDEPPNPADIFKPRALRKKTPEVEPDEEDWVPWRKVPEATCWRGARTYTGNVSVSVYPVTEAQLLRRCVHADPPSGAADFDWEASSEQLVVAASDRKHHSDYATSVRELLAKTPAERGLLAPFLEPVVSFPPEGEELVHRYYRVPEGQRPLMYVGETWVKKVPTRTNTRSLHHVQIRWPPSSPI